MDCDQLVRRRIRMWCELTKHRHDHDTSTHPIDPKQQLRCVSKHAADPSGFWLHHLQELHGVWDEDVESAAVGIPLYDATIDAMCPLRSTGHFHDKQQRRTAMARSLTIVQEARTLMQRIMNRKWQRQAGGAADTAGAADMPPEDEAETERACCVEGAFLSLSRRHRDCLGCYEKKEAGLALCWRCWRRHGGALCWTCHQSSVRPTNNRTAFMSTGTQSLTQWLGVRPPSRQRTRSRPTNHKLTRHEEDEDHVDCGEHTTFANYASFDEQALQAQVAACAQIMRRFPEPCPPPSRGSF